MWREYVASVAYNSGIIRGERSKPVINIFLDAGRHRFLVARIRKLVLCGPSIVHGVWTFEYMLDLVCSDWVTRWSVSFVPGVPAV